MESYWTYELCHGRFIRQYHQEGGKNGKLTEYNLGRWNIESFDDKGKHAYHISPFQGIFLDDGQTDVTVTNYSISLWKEPLGCKRLKVTTLIL